LNHVQQRLLIEFMMLNCVIVDDEPLAREGLTDFVNEVDFLDLRGTCENPVQLVNFLEHHPVDLLFLDIQMPKMTGIDFLKVTRNAPMAIMTTAYSEFAIEGFRLNVIDYLLKPVTFERFLQAVNKARDYHRFLLNPAKGGCDHFFIKCANKYEKIFFEEILYLESMQNYVTIYTEKGKYRALLNLKTLEQEFDHRNFIRVHKSYMVAIGKIDAVQGNEIRIRSLKIPIGRSYREQVISQVVQSKLVEHTDRKSTFEQNNL
jgi:two-component system, LytTR family, response regulator